MDKKNATWKSFRDFQEIIISRENPLMVSIEKQITNKNKVTIFWEEDSSSKLFDETETFKVSVSIVLAEKLIQSGLAVKAGNSNEEKDFLAILDAKIAEKQAPAEELE